MNANAAKSLTQENTGAWQAAALSCDTTTSCSLEELERQEQLVLKHQALVRLVACGMARRLPARVDLDELISAGMVALWEAASRFDASKQVQFKTFAGYRIRGAIMDHLRSLDWGPRDIRRKGRKKAQIIESLIRRLGRLPEEDEIAASMGVELAEYQRLNGDLAALDLRSLDRNEPDEWEQDRVAKLATPETDDPLFLCLQDETRERVTEAIENLSERERLVITLRYYEELTMKEIGEILGVVESRISQIHSNALSRLRKSTPNAPASRRRSN